MFAMISLYWEANLANAAKEFFDNTSAAMAGMSGVVYVLPVRANRFKKTLWDKYEWPHLEDNSKTTKLIRVNLDNGKPRKRSRGRAWMIKSCGSHVWGKEPTNSCSALN
jgi:hypothetical protein